MRLLGLGLLLSILPCPALAVIVDMELESMEVPLYGAACGVLAFSNDRATSLEIDYPSLLRCTIWFEVRDGEQVRKLRETNTVRFKYPGRVTLDPRQTIYVPFYVMKDDMRYVFDKEGDFQIRVVFSTREGNDRNRKVAVSDWMSVSITSNSLSEEWRREFISRHTLLMPFSFVAPDEAIKYVGTGYYKTYNV